MRRVLLAIGCLAIAAATSQAAVILSDNFDGYASSADLHTPSGPYGVVVSPGMSLDTTKGHSDGQSVTAGSHEAAPHLRSYINLGGEYDGSDAQPLKMEFWMSMSADNDWWTREYIELRAYSGAGYGDGTLQDLIAFGCTSSGVPDTGKYAARAMSGAGWVSTTIAKKTDWAKMTVLIKSSTIEFYVDDVLGYSGSVGDYKYDSVVLFSGLSSRVQVWYDDLLVEQVPEPAALMLLGLGSVLFVRRRRA